MSITYLPLQDMIASVVKTASDRLVSEKNTAHRIKTAASEEASAEEETCEHCGKEKDACECGSKMASFTDPDFVEKLASVVDYIAQNVENIAPPNRGVLGSVLSKLAENGVSVPATNPEGALEVTTPPNGEQQYKKDKPAGEDAAASQAGTAETKANMPGGSTQISNNMDKAPGQGSGSVPSATYPADGPFHAGKTAGAAGAITGALRGAAGHGALGGLAGAGLGAITAPEGHSAERAKSWGKKGLMAGGVIGAIPGAIGGHILEDLAKHAGRLGAIGARASELMAGGKKMPFASGGKGRSIGKVMDKRPGNSLSAMTQRTGAGSEARKSLGVRAAGAASIGGVGVSAAHSAKKNKSKEKTAAELARELILNKLAGEDVMRANISSSGDGGPLVGDGELEALMSDDVPSNPTDGSGYGNDQRSLIASNEAAINYTKGEAKKPQGKQMSEVLTNPAFSPTHDSKLREQLQNAGEAGVKIAGAAAATSFLKQAAARGVLTQETVNSFKERVKTASAITAPGAMPDPSGDAAVAKLRNMIDTQRKQKASMGDDGGVY